MLVQLSYYLCYYCPFGRFNTDRCQRPRAGINKMIEYWIALCPQCSIYQKLTLASAAFIFLSFRTLWGPRGLLKKSCFDTLSSFLKAKKTLRCSRYRKNISSRFGCFDLSCSQLRAKMPSRRPKHHRLFFFVKDKTE